MMNGTLLRGHCFACVNVAHVGNGRRALGVDPVRSQVPRRSAVA